MVLGSRTALLGAVVVLAVANLLNNWLAPSAYLVTAVVASAMLLGLLRSAGGTWAEAGLGRDATRRGLWWGMILVAGATIAVVAAVMTPATRHLFLDPRVEGAGSSEIAFAALVRVPFGTVLLEEIGFRGVVYGLAARMWGFAWATVISSGLFGLWHVYARHRSRVNPPGLRPAARGRIAVWCHRGRRSRCARRIHGRCRDV